MSYFSRLPNLYIAEGISSLENFKYRLAKNLFRRVNAREDLSKYTTFFESYEIRDGDTPPSLAYELTGESENDWIILMVNNIIDVYEEWPKTDSTMQSYIEAKYSALDDIHHWETNETLYNDIVFIKQGIEVNETFRAVLPDGTRLTKDQSIYPVTNYEYETYLNELKRNILIPNPQIIDLIVEEFDDLVAYQSNLELDNDENKKTTLSIAQLFLNRRGSVYASAARSSDIGVVTSFDYGSLTGSAVATAGVVQTTTVTSGNTNITTSSNSSSSSSSSSGSSSGSGY
jgi:hypothetical protein